MNWAQNHSDHDKLSSFCGKSMVYATTIQTESENH